MDRTTSKCQSCKENQVAPARGLYICTPCKSGYLSNGNRTKCFDADECRAMRDACYNGAACVNTEGSYRCECGAGYKGKSCEDDINECENLPCKNGAPCTNLKGGYKCRCPANYQGKNCDVDVDECTKNPCKNSGKCHNIVGSYKCSCTLSWTGPNCEKGNKLLLHDHGQLTSIKGPSCFRGACLICCFLVVLHLIS